MIQNKTLFSKALSISDLSEKLYGMSNSELIDLRKKIEQIIKEHREAITPTPEEDIDFEVDLEDINFDDDILSVKEATLFADLFDEIGEHSNANLMDDYIRKFALTEGDLIKQAGLFKNLLRKLVGFGKRVFFKVYRELYAKAKEAQKLLDDRIDEINETYDNIKKDLRYHDLEGWRGGIYALKLEDSKDIIGDFDIAYGKLVQYLGLTGETKDKSKKKDESQIGKLPDLSKPEGEETEEPGTEEPGTEEPGTEEPGAEKATSWERMTPGAQEGWTELAKSVAFNPSSGGIRFDKKYFDYLLGKHLSTDGAGNVKYWSSYKEQKQPMGGKLKDMMGEDAWDMKQDKNYVYLFPKTTGTDVGAPTIEMPESEKEVKFEDPKLPVPEEGSPFARKPAPEEEVFPLTDKKETKLEDLIKETPEEEAPEEVFPLTDKKEPKLEDILEETPEEKEVPEKEAPEKVEKSPAAELVRKQNPREALWIERSKPQRQKDGELWTRFTKVYPTTAQRYETSGTGKIVSEPDTIAFLDNATPRQFPGHSANVNKLWLPTDLDRRKQYVEMAETNWAEETKKTSSIINRIQELYKMSTR
jgi:hypothetical protein